jgi:hypothetical protein
MNNAALVRVLDCLANFDHQLEALVGVELVFLGILDQRRAVDQFHGEVRLHAEWRLGRSRFVNLPNAGIATSRRGWSCSAS